MKNGAYGIKFFKKMVWVNEKRKERRNNMVNERENNKK
ncbi:hypothetical protein OUG_0250 [Helicobacter pylori R32b]|nr:hypothetical protein OUG_1200 [Helicobacter pylori R32b]EKE87428.1 hypothetical protein OUG_0250 [Helicobacter pylori R32b]